MSVAYVWSSLLPLSLTVTGEIRSATGVLNLGLVGVTPATLRAEASRTSSEYDGRAPNPSRRHVADALLAAGATIHYPAVIVFRDGEIVGPAIVGYKTAETYRRLIEERLAAPASSERYSGLSGSDAGIVLTSTDTTRWTDFPVDGNVGAYFRWVPGTATITFASPVGAFALDLRHGQARPAPGHVDLVPSPDGRLLVTPWRNRGGLYFFDTEQALAGARAGRGRDVPPVFRDTGMKDQYPSVGILRGDRRGRRESTVYRVLTSWFDRVVFRDYEVRPAQGNRPPAVRPLGNPVPACDGMQLSIPIMAQNGRELAARDERTASTKLFRLHNNGRCDEILDLGMQTGKVAFSADGRRVAFAIPRGLMGDARGNRWVGMDSSVELAGIFVLFRDELRITWVAGSEAVNRLAFPEFVGRDSVAFLLVGSDDGSGSRFRVVCCVR